MPATDDGGGLPQFVIVYGPLNEKPTVYATAYTPSERDNQVKLCAERHGTFSNVRSIRGDLLDPANTRVRAVPGLDA